MWDTKANNPDEGQNPHCLASPAASGELFKETARYHIPEISVEDFITHTQLKLSIQLHQLEYDIFPSFCPTKDPPPPS
jgi:hypothetical protein